MRNIIHTFEEYLLRSLPDSQSFREPLQIPYTFASMEEFDSMTDDLCQKCKDFEPDIVVGLLQSGFYPSYKISEKFKSDIDFIKISTNYLRDIIWLQHLTYMRDPATGEIQHRLMSLNKKDLTDRKVLIVDDESSSGATLNLAKRVVERGRAAEIKTAVLVSYIEEHGDFNSRIITPFSHLTYIHLPSRRYSPFFKQYEEKVRNIHEENPWMRNMG
jgi:hypoxanthine phosphoribosyltransferase